MLFDVLGCVWQFRKLTLFKVFQAKNVLGFFVGCSSCRLRFLFFSVFVGVKKFVLVVFLLFQIVMVVQVDSGRFLVVLCSVVCSRLSSIVECVSIFTLF